MLDLNVTRVLNLRGITQQKYGYLTKNGFIRSTSSKLLNNQTWQVRFSILERLCLLLNCTPNDLFEWRPDENQTVNENTALKVLIRKEKTEAISQIVKDIPLEKLERAREMLARLKDEELTEK